MTRRLAALSLALALALGTTLLQAQDSIDPKTGKKRGPLEVWRDRDRPNKAPSQPTASPNPPRDVTRIHDRDHDRDRSRDERRRVALHREHERREQLERERRERERHERVERERRERFERARANQPHGWSKGKKTGWGDCDLPPGQAKKYGCHSDGHSHHHSKKRG